MKSLELLSLLSLFALPVTACDVARLITTYGTDTLRG